MLVAIAQPTCTRPHRSFFQLLMPCFHRTKVNRCWACSVWGESEKSWPRGHKRGAKLHVNVVDKKQTVFSVQMGEGDVCNSSPSFAGSKPGSSSAAARRTNSFMARFSFQNAGSCFSVVMTSERSCADGCSILAALHPQKKSRCWNQKVPKFLSLFLEYQKGC
jgi:hypothetical protein